MTFRTDNDEPARAAARKTFRAPGEKPVRKEGAAEDTTKSLLAGIPRGVTGMLGMAGDLRHLARMGMEKAGMSDEQIGLVRGMIGAALNSTGRTMNTAQNARPLNAPNMATAGPDTRQVRAAVTRAPVVGPMLGAVVNREPQTRAGRFADVAGQFAVNALVPGPKGAGLIPTAAAKTAAVVVPAVASEGAGQLAEAAGATPGQAAVARIAGGLAGGVASSLRLPQAAARGVRVEQSALAKLNRQAPQNVGTLRANAAELQSHGIPAPLVDVVDESGRGVIRSAASRMTTAREEVVNYAEAAPIALPRRMSVQARKHLSDDPRTPTEIGSDLASGRRANASANYGAVQGDEIQMAPETVAALRTGHGQAAIKAAIQGERDPNVRARLNGLLTDVIDNPSTPITVGMADSISKALYGQARGTTDNNLSGVLTGLGHDVRNPTRAASPGYGAAVDDFAAESRLIDSAARGETYLKPDTDAFRADLAANGPEGLPLARASARRAVERASGENVSAAPGVARRIATAPEVQARTRALLPEQQAQAFERAMTLEAERVKNAAYINPNAGSKTASAMQDAVETGGEVAAVAAQAGSGHVIGAALSAAKLWLRGQGLNRREAEALARLAIDPDRTALALTRLEARIGAPRAQAFVRLLNQPGPLLLSASSAERQ